MEKLKTLTIRQIHDWRPSNSGPDESFGRKALEKLFGGDSIPVLQFVDLDIPSGARLFVVLRPEVLGDAFAPCLADIAEHVLPIFQQKLPDDERPARAIAAIRGFARGEVGKGDLLTASRATENAGYDDNAPNSWLPPGANRSHLRPQCRYGGPLRGPGRRRRSQSRPCQPGRQICQACLPLCLRCRGSSGHG